MTTITDSPPRRKESQMRDRQRRRFGSESHLIDPNSIIEQAERFDSYQAVGTEGKPCGGRHNSDAIDLGCFCSRLTRQASLFACFSERSADPECSMNSIAARWCDLIELIEVVVRVRICGTADGRGGKASEAEQVQLSTTIRPQTFRVFSDHEIISRTQSCFLNSFHSGSFPMRVWGWQKRNVDGTWTRC